MVEWSFTDDISQTSLYKTSLFCFFYWHLIIVLKLYATNKEFKIVFLNMSKKKVKWKKNTDNALDYIMLA